MPSLELRTLRPEDEHSFKEAVAEFKRETPPWLFAFYFDESASFPGYINRLEHWSQGLEIPEPFVPNTFYVGVVDGIIVGRLSLRHCLNDFLEKIGGHIGYGIVPSQRNRGYATEMLRQALPHCAALGIARALVTCDENNLASEKVIQNCGGILEGITDFPGLKIQKKRYWINTGDSEPKT